MEDARAGSEEPEAASNLAPAGVFAELARSLAEATGIRARAAPQPGDHRRNERRSRERKPRVPLSPRCASPLQAPAVCSLVDRFEFNAAPYARHSVSAHF